MKKALITISDKSPAVDGKRDQILDAYNYGVEDAIREAFKMKVFNHSGNIYNVDDNASAVNIAKECDELHILVTSPSANTGCVKQLRDNKEVDKKLASLSLIYANFRPEYAQHASNLLPFFDCIFVPNSPSEFVDIGLFDSEDEWLENPYFQQHVIPILGCPSNLPENYILGENIFEANKTSKFRFAILIDKVDFHTVKLISEINKLVNSPLCTVGNNYFTFFIIDESAEFEHDMFLGLTNCNAQIYENNEESLIKDYKSIITTSLSTHQRFIAFDSIRLGCTPLVRTTDESLTDETFYISPEECVKSIEDNHKNEIDFYVNQRLARNFMKELTEYFEPASLDAPEKNEKPDSEQRPTIKQ
jgi:hypothetical protein